MNKKKNSPEVKELIELGREKGYLTYEEVNNALPSEVVSPDQMDDLMVMFGEMEIEIVDAVQKAHPQSGQDQTAESSTAESAKGS